MNCGLRTPGRLSRSMESLKPLLAACELIPRSDRGRGCCCAGTGRAAKTLGLQHLVDLFWNGESTLVEYGGQNGHFRRTQAIRRGCCSLASSGVGLNDQDKAI